MERPENFGVTTTGRIIRPRQEGDRWRGPRVYRGSVDDAIAYITGMGREGNAPPGTNELLMNIQNDPMLVQHLGRMASNRPTMKELLQRYETTARRPRGHLRTPFRTPVFRPSLFEVARPGREAENYVDPDPETPRMTAREMVDRTKEKERKGKNDIRDVVRDRVRSSRLVPRLWTRSRP